MTPTTVNGQQFYWRKEAVKTRKPTNYTDVLGGPRHRTSQDIGTA